MTEPYDYKNYWQELHGRDGLSSVGHSALPDSINNWIYRTRERNLRSFAKAHGLDGGRMLEVGIGTGYWIPFWQSLGYTVDGCDLVDSAVDRLREQWSGGRYWQADVSSSEGILDPAHSPPAEGYDLVVVMDVLLHVTDDAAFDQAVRNLAAVVRPGGLLLLGEPVLTQTDRQPHYNPKYSSRARILKTYRRPLRLAGMKLLAVEPSTALACNPIEAKTSRRLRAYHRWWDQVRRTRTHPRLAMVYGPLMYALDPLVMRRGEAPTSKLMLFRRRIKGN